MPATQIRDGAAAQVHVRLRLRQEHPAPPDRSTADGGPPVLLIHGDAQTPAHPVDDLPPHVVAGVRVVKGTVGSAPGAICLRKEKRAVARQQFPGCTAPGTRYML